MNEEDLESLITLDDPGEDDLEEDTFEHPQAEHTLEDWLGQSFTASQPTGSRQGKKDK